MDDQVGKKPRPKAPEPSLKTEPGQAPGPAETVPSPSTPEPKPTRRSYIGFGIGVILVILFAIIVYRVVSKPGESTANRHVSPPQSVGVVDCRDRRHSHYFKWPRHRHAARDRHGGDANQRPAPDRRIPGRPARQEGRFSRPDRSAAVRGDGSSSSKASSRMTRACSIRRARISSAFRLWRRRIRSPCSRRRTKPFSSNRMRGRSSRIRRRSTSRSSISNIAISSRR